MTNPASTDVEGRVEFLNPDGLPRSPAFSNVAVVSGRPAHPDFLVEMDAIAAVLA